MSEPVEVHFHNMDPVSAARILHKLEHIESKINRINARVFGLTLGVQQMALDMSALEAEVSQNSDAVDSATTLLTRLAEEIRTAAGDPAKIADLASRLDAASTRLAEAVVANTPTDTSGGGETPPQ